MMIFINIMLQQCRILYKVWKWIFFKQEPSFKAHFERQQNVKLYGH